MILCLEMAAGYDHLVRAPGSGWDQAWTNSALLHLQHDLRPLCAVLTPQLSCHKVHSIQVYELLTTTDGSLSVSRICFSL